MEPNRKYFSQPEEAGLERMTARLAAACEGLIYISETDATVEPVSIPRLIEFSSVGLLKFLRRSEEETIQTVDAAEFLGRLSEPKEWHNELEKEIARRFGQLRDVLQNELEDLRVYRVGESRVDIFILGWSASGTIAGVRTRAVET